LFGLLFIVLNFNLNLYPSLVVVALLFIRSIWWFVCFFSTSSSFSISISSDCFSFVYFLLNFNLSLQLLALCSRRKARPLSLSCVRATEWSIISFAISPAAL
jgi:hypothetical protein